jgi:hypothetical protein
MKKSVFILFLVLFNSLLFAQNSNYADFITKTEAVLAKAKKQILASKRKDFKGKLVEAFLLQGMAVKDYKTNNFSMSACNAGLSLSYSLELLKEVGYNNIDKAYLLSENESVLITNCLTDELLLNRSEISFPDIKDKEDSYFLTFGTSVLETNIE